MTNEEKLKIYEQRDLTRKSNVKKYFARRNVRFDTYKKFFEKNANANEKQILNDMLSKI